MSSSKRLLALLALMAFCGVVWLLVTSAKTRSPVYQGKTVKTWLLQLSAADAASRAEAEAAFKALDTNAVPELARLTLADDAGWRKWIRLCALRLPGPLRNRILTRVRPPQAALVRPAAARALGRLGPGAAPALPELTRALQDTVNGTCWEAATALGRIGVRAVPALTAALQDEDALVRCAAARGLGEAGPEAASAVPALIQMLSRASTNEQSFAAQSLAGIGTPAVAPLINLLLHAEGAFGEAAAGALLRHYGRPGPPLPAVKDPPGDQTTAARRQAVEALRASDRDNELVTRLLAGAVKDPAPQVRLAAIQALAQGSRNPRAALPSLAAALRDESPAIREWSARVLGQLGPSAKPAVPRLIPLAQDDNPAVRAAARQALAAIDPAWKTNAAPAPR